MLEGERTQKCTLHLHKRYVRFFNYLRTEKIILWKGTEAEFTKAGVRWNADVKIKGNYFLRPLFSSLFQYFFFSVGMNNEDIYSNVYKHSLLIKKSKSILLHSLEVMCGIQM